MDVTEASAIRRAVTRNRDPLGAAQELQQGLAETRPGLVILFVDAEYDLNSLASALARGLGDVPLIGCTTAGEITPNGYETGCAVAVSLPADHFVAAVGAIDGVTQLDPVDVHRLGRQLLESVRRRGTEPSSSNTFALVLIDGLSASEETVANMVSGALGEIHLFGGSAGDGLRFKRTAVLCDGSFRSDRAVLALIQTDLPFSVFKTQHFVPSSRKLVVTGADVRSRRVTEIDGEPAALAYAHAVGVAPADLTPDVFATSPVVIRIGGDLYVRSIQKVNEDGSLTFYCAIDEGIVLTLATGVDLLENLSASFDRLRQQLGPLRLVLGCDCILRRLEVERRNIGPQLSGILSTNQVIGFSTYGEQWNGMHVNQTFTGVAIGMEPPQHA